MMNNPQLPFDPARLLHLVAAFAPAGAEIPLPVILSLIGVTGGPTIRMPEATSLSGVKERTLRKLASGWLAEQEADQRPQVRVAKTSARGRAHWEFNHLDIILLGVANGVPAARQAAAERGLLHGPAGSPAAAAGAAGAPADAPAPAAPSLGPAPTEGRAPRGRPEIPTAPPGQGATAKLDFAALAKAHLAGGGA
jgi:hypothetical protein